MNAWLRKHALLLAGGLVVIAIVTHSASSGLHESQIEGCDRSKVNSAQIAKTAWSRVRYLDRVLAATSVKADVKAAAADQRADELATAHLFDRRSLANCETLYPAPGWFG